MSAVPTMSVFVFLVLFCFSPVLASFDRYNRTCVGKAINQCQDLRSAVKCKAVQHCVKTVWSQAKANDDICDLCKRFMGVVADMVKDKTVQDAVQKVLHQGCNLIPIKQFADKCNDLVDTYLQIIIDLLEKEVEPDALCAALGLCKSLQEESLYDGTAKAKLGVDNFSPISNQVWRRIKEPLPKHRYTCESCHLLMKKLQRLLPEGKTEAAVAKLPRKVCSRMTGKYLTKCHGFMERFGETAMDLLSKEVQPRAVCDILRICSTVDSKELALPLMPCDMCENVVRQFKAALNKGTRMDLMLQETCNPFLDISNFVCEEFVYVHAPALTNISEYPEDFDLCGALRICTRKVDAHFNRILQPV
ncbi:pulmonary surfactant-associated protein B isoform X2 [Rhincodon typus]|uniref:pulmonary surfactant-associated protein B isoform X2 n=1 Tax=Rhincodon typus TaxID=259920 RepID=UPI00202F7D8D|nr:pulmonary surfactant-associated protein B isoform X2 [Rhincodon typus]